MKSIRGFALGLAFGLAAAISSVGLAQNAKPAKLDKKAESCCAMASCCCKGDSCSIKDGAKTHSSQDGCCCCNGDSCDMKIKMKDKQKQG